MRVAIPHEKESHQGAVCAHVAFAPGPPGNLPVRRRHLNWQQKVVVCSSLPLLSQRLHVICARDSSARDRRHAAAAEKQFPDAIQIERREGSSNGEKNIPKTNVRLINGRGYIRLGSFLGKFEKRRSPFPRVPLVVGAVLSLSLET